MSALTAPFLATPARVPPERSPYLTAPAAAALTCLTVGLVSPWLTPAAMPAVVSGAPMVAAVMVAVAWSLRGRPRWVMVVTFFGAVCGLPAATRLTMVASAWSAAPLGLTAAGALLGLYAVATAEAFAPRVGPPAVRSRWRVMLDEAERARDALKAELAAHPAAATSAALLQDRADRLVGAMAAAVPTWERLDRQFRDDQGRALRSRLEDTLHLVDAETDPATRAELSRTADALRAQVDAAERLRRNAARALTRMRAQVAVMETARLQVMASASADASAAADAQAVWSAGLQTAVQEMDAYCVALEDASLPEPPSAALVAPRDASAGS